MVLVRPYATGALPPLQAWSFTTDPGVLAAWPEPGTEAMAGGAGESASCVMKEGGSTPNVLSALGQPSDRLAP